MIPGLRRHERPRPQPRIVPCVYGAVFDAAVDLRLGSPTYGAFVASEFAAPAVRALLVPESVAHGFCALTDNAVTCSVAASEHSPELDPGVCWDSVGIPWPVTDPVLSKRDRALPPLGKIESTFRDG